MSLTPKHYLCVSRLPPAVRSSIASAVVGRAITLGEAADTLFEATTMPTVAHPILDATMSPNQDSNKEHES